MHLRPHDIGLTKGQEASAPRSDGNTQTFLGYEWSKEEYQMIARNLADYFSILKKWQAKEHSGEEEENL